MPRTVFSLRRPARTLLPALGLVFIGWHFAPVGLTTLVAPSARAAAVFTVNSTADTDDGACTAAPQGCTLREALNAANAASGADTIAFNIAGAGVQTITPATPLPAITDSVVIDGYTQPGASPNTLADGNDAVLRVELNGSLLSSSGGQLHRGLVISAGASTVRGLVINRFPGEGVVLQTVGNNVVEGNFIGLSADGASGAGNSAGVVIMVGSSDNLVGGSAPAARNVISGNSVGIRILATQQAALRNIIRGNFIGTDASGTRAVGNNSGGISLDTGTNIIGGTAPGDRNVISGNQNNAGIFIINGPVSSPGNTVQGNFIGTDATGTRPLGNFFGVWINFGSNNIIGGSAATAGNVISGNRNTGVFINGDLSRNNQLGGNLIGTDATGARPLGNAAHGVEIGGSANGNAVQQQGPDAPMNTIAFNGASGVAVIAPPSRNNAIRRNNIFSNGGLGIDLDGDGVTPNDAGDADQGGNDYQNFPVITSAVSDGATTTIQGTLNSKPNTVYGLDFFTNSGCDPSGHGEGARFFNGSGTTTDANGNATFTINFPTPLPAGRVVTATATENNAGSRNTSEFSPCNPAGAAGNVQFSAASYEVGEDGGNAVITLVRASGSSGALTVNFATAGGTATAGDDYTAVSEAVTFADGETTKTVTVPIFINGATEPDETVGLVLFNTTNPDAVGARATAVLTIIDSSKAVAFNAASFTASEGTHTVTITVTRTGTPAAASVGYATSDGTASERKDYTAAVGRLRFGPGETSKSFNVIITDDRFDDDGESFNVTLSNPSGVTLGTQKTAVVNIADNDAANGISPVRDAAFNTEFFVRQHYADFLNRVPDADGLQFWMDGIDSCGADAQCREVKKIDTSAAFFLSIENQETGFLAHRTHKVAFGDLAGKPVPLTLRDFLSDSRQLADGVIVGTPGWPEKLEANKVAYFNEFVTRAAFVARYPESLNAGQYVDALFATAGVTPTQAERSAAINAFVFGGAAGRARALRSVAESQTVKTAETNRAFVLMQYFGYLRRNPDDPDFQNNPDPQFLGYTFWLTKLNQFNGNYVEAEMVKAFIQSIEYGDRFGQ